MVIVFYPPCCDNSPGDFGNYSFCSQYVPQELFDLSFTEQSENLTDFANSSLRFHKSTYAFTYHHSLIRFVSQSFRYLFSILLSPLKILPFSQLGKLRLSLWALILLFVNFPSKRW